MGQAIESIAESRGHSVVLKINDTNLSDFTKENLQKADVAIEFTRPEYAFANIKSCIEWGVPIVSGTTGWLDKYSDVEALVAKTKGAFFYASNYSVGVNIFFEVNKHLAKLMGSQSEYSVSMEEIHHMQKLDAPSGTAITLAEGIYEGMPSKNKWVNESTSEEDSVGIVSKREPNVPGTHTIFYDCAVDTIEIKHTAHSRKGFATGAVLAAEFIKEKEGVFGMSDMLGI